MDEIDKREKRSEYRNVRQGAQGKGDSNSRVSPKEFSEGHEGIDWSKKGDKKAEKIMIESHIGIFCGPDCDKCRIARRHKQ